MSGLVRIDQDPGEGQSLIHIYNNTELDNHYLKYHAEKARRIAERGDKCCKTAPEARDAAMELLEELCVSVLSLYLLSQQTKLK